MPTDAPTWDDTSSIGPSWDETTDAVSTLEPVPLKDRIRHSAIAEAILGPTELEKGEMPSPPVAPMNLAEVPFTFTSAGLPPVRKASDWIADKSIEASKAVLGDYSPVAEVPIKLSQAARNVGIGFPLAGGPSGAIGKSILAYYGSDWAASLPEQWNQFTSAIKSGDYPEATRIAAEATGMGAMFGLGGVHAIRGKPAARAAQQEVPNALKIEQATPVSGSELRTQVGEETPLRQGEATAQKEAEPVLTKPEVPAEYSAEDRARYNEIGTVLRKPPWPSNIQELLAEREKIKAKYGGKTPETKAVAPEEPLGLNRPDVIDPSLRKLTDQEFDKEYRSATKLLNDLEKQYDEQAGELTPSQRSKLAAAQDRWTSADLENERRNYSEVHTEDVFRAMLNLADRGSDSAYARFKVLAEVLKERGDIKPEDVVGSLRELPERIRSSPDFQEVLGGKMAKFKEWLGRVASETTPIVEPPKPKGKRRGKAKTEDIVSAQPPEVSGVQFGGVQKGGGVAPDSWTFKVTTGDKPTNFSTPIGATAEEIAAKRDTKLSEIETAKTPSPSPTGSEPTPQTTPQPSAGKGDQKVPATVHKDPNGNPVVSRAPEASSQQPTPGKAGDAARAAAQAIRKLKISGEGKVYDITAAVGEKVWNGAVEAAALVLEAGGKMADAVDAAIKHIRENYKGKFDEAEVRRAFIGEKAEPKEGETFGIAARVTEERAARGRVAGVSPGKGIASESAVERGRQLIAEGIDPNDVLKRFDETKALSGDDMAVVRAEGERLARETDAAAQTHGTDSPQYKRAWQSESDWIQRIKPMQTEWHRIGQAQQGETEINTGTFHGLQRAYFQQTGKNFDERQTAQAKDLADRAQKAEAQVASLQEQLQKQIESAVGQQPKVSDYVLKAAEAMVARWDARADIAREKLRGKFLSPTPEDLLELAYIARANIGHMGLDFAKWSDKMVQELGPKVRPYLESAWGQATKWIENETKKIAHTETREAVRKQVTKQPSRNLSQEVWQIAKDDYLAKGVKDFDDIVHGIAEDLGVPVDEIRKALAPNKSAKRVSDEMYRQMSEQRRLQNQARGWLKNQTMPGWERFARAVPRVFFIDKVMGHGTTFMVTHAGLNIFDPRAWHTYFPTFFRQFGIVFKPAYHERLMQDLVRDPNYTMARRAGLANDPYRYTDDYQNALMKSFMGKFQGLAGGRGADALKLFRQAQFNQWWNRLPNTLQTPEMAALMADSINHSTGVVSSRFPDAAYWTFFAPKLEASRWAWMFRDTAKAARTFSEWKTATPEAKEAAMAELKQKAVVAGMYFGMLALNQGLLSAVGSSQKVNFTDPRRTDFLAFKIAGHTVGVISPMIGIVRLFANLYHASMGKRGPVESLTPRGNAIQTVIGQYARGKLSPFSGTAFDIASQSDFQGRPLPWSSDKTPAYLRRRGEGRYGYGEWALEQFAPIPAAEAISEVFASQGMGKSQMETYLNALAVGVAAGGTGARIKYDFFQGR